MPELSVNWIDITVLLLYVFGTRLLFAWWINRKQINRDAEGYFLGGRNLAWPLIGFSFYVSNMSGSTFIALPGSGYDQGIAAYHYEWLPALILFFFTAYMLPVYLRTRVFTAPEYLENRFNGQVRRIFSGFLLAANIIIDAAAALYAGSMVLSVLFPSIPVVLLIAGMALVAGVYITAGGLEAVVLNDALQALLILAGGSLIALLAWNQVPGWDAVREATPDKALHLFLPPDDPVMPWPGILSGVLVVGLYFWCTNQFMIQRALATKSLREGRKGSIFAGFLKLPNLFILIIPGVLAKYLYPELERPDLVFPVLALDILPQGVRGIILAALAAAILSSLESIYNSAATLFTRDFLRHRFPKISEKGEVRAGQAATLVFMVVSALWAPWITEFPTLWQYLQSILSYLTPPVVAVFLGGMFWKGATDRGARYALLGGIPIGMAGWIANEVMGLLDIQYLYASGIMFVLGWLFMIAGSILPGGVKGKDETVFQQGDWIDRDEEGKKVPWYRSYIAYGMLLALVAGTIVWIWR